MIKTLIAAALIFFTESRAKESHSHHEKEEQHQHEEKHEHGQDHAIDHDHDHGEEKNNQVGPGKGIISADESEGFQISPQAEKNFEIQRHTIQQGQAIELPKSAVVTAGTEVNLYRYRDGHYKRVDFELIQKIDNKIIVRSKEIKKGDEIVIRGMGLLRIAEIAAFGGAPEGHSH